MTTRTREYRWGSATFGGFYRKVQNGTNGRETDNPYSVTIDSEIYRPYQVEKLSSSECGWSSYVSEESFIGIMGGALVPPAPDIDDSILLSKLDRRANKQAIDVGVFVGEGKESLQMIRSGVKTLSTLYTAIRRFDVRGIQRTLSLSRGNMGEFLDALSTGWLAWNFGVKPILSDMHAAGETLARLVSNEPSKTSIRAKVVERSPVYARNQHIGYRESGKQVIVRYIESELASLAYELGVHRNQLFSLAWELVPLSFVVDSVVPIGSFLDNAAVQARFRQHASVTTTWDKTVWYGRVNHPCYKVITDGYHTYRGIKLQRTVGTGLDHLNSVPSLRFPASWFWAATDLSLLWQRFGTNSPGWVKFDTSVFNQPAKRRAIR